MIKHKWSNNKCVVCGITRKRKSWKTLMAIVNHPPWEGWMRGVDWCYYGESIPVNGTFQRPDCIKANTIEA